MSGILSGLESLGLGNISTTNLYESPEKPKEGPAAPVVVEEKDILFDRTFTCPVCDKDIKFVNPSAVPQKKGYRIIAFDQATERFGLSIFEDGQLIFYSLYTFSGDVTHRLVKIKKFVQDVVIKE